LDEIFRDDRNSDFKCKLSMRKDEEAERITGKMEHKINTVHGELAGGWISGGRTCPL